MSLSPETCRNFNTFLFTEAETPLPLADEEKLLYYGDNVKFYIRVGDGNFLSTTRYISRYGAVFVTTHRLIYIPKTHTINFCSFFAPTNAVIDITQSGSKKLELSVLLHGGAVGKIQLGMRENLPETFVIKLKEVRALMQRLE